MVRASSTLHPLCRRTLSKDRLICLSRAQDERLCVLPWKVSMVLALKSFSWREHPQDVELPSFRHVPRTTTCLPHLQSQSQCVNGEPSGGVASASTFSFPNRRPLSLSFCMKVFPCWLELLFSIFESGRNRLDSFSMHDAAGTHDNFRNLSTLACPCQEWMWSSIMRNHFEAFSQSPAELSSASGLLDKQWHG